MGFMIILGSLTELSCYLWMRKYKQPWSVRDLRCRNVYYHDGQYSRIMNLLIGIEYGQYVEEL